MGNGFEPFRRNIKFAENVKEVDIHTVKKHLTFIQDKQRYGYPFRYGHFEINRQDFFYLAAQMDILKKRDQKEIQ